MLINFITQIFKCFLYAYNKKIITFFNENALILYPYFLNSKFCIFICYFFDMQNTDKQVHLAVLLASMILLNAENIFRT